MLDATYSRTFTSYLLDEQSSLAQGLYTLTARNATGTAAVIYKYQPTRHELPVIDFKTFRTDAAGSSFKISWAPIASSVPVWYKIKIFSKLGPAPPYIFIQQGNSVTFRATSAYAIAISAQDGYDDSVVNNVSRALVFVNGGAGYDYSTLTDIDGDGYASNCDTNDNDPSITIPIFAPNTSPPTVSSSYPVNAATGFGLIEKPYVYFTKVIDQRTLPVPSRLQPVPSQSLGLLITVLRLKHFSLRRHH